MIDWRWAAAAAVVALLGAGCGPSSNLPQPESPPQRGVRLLVDTGGRTEMWSTLRPGELQPTASPTVVPSATPRPTTTPKPSPTPVRSPTAKPTVTPTPMMPTPTARSGPAPGAVVAAFLRYDSYRAQVTGPAVFVQEVADRRRMRVIGERPFAGELIVDGPDTFVRVGPSWVLLRTPRPELSERLGDRVKSLTALEQRTFVDLGVTSARAGKCREWEVVDAGPKEPHRLCIAAPGDLPYRLNLPGGVTLELYDFGAEIAVPVPPRIVGG